MCPHLFTMDCDKGRDRKQHGAACAQTKEWLTEQEVMAEGGPRVSSSQRRL